MLLRSSSTPVLGSLLPSFSSESPNHNHYYQQSPLNSKLSCHQTGYAIHLTTISSCNSSPISPSFADFSSSSHRGIRRAQSEGNLEGLAYATCHGDTNNNEEKHSLGLPKKISGRQKCSVLETIPSFSLSNLRHRHEEEEEDDEEGEEMEENYTGLSNRINTMVVIEEEERVLNGEWEVGFEENRRLVSEEMRLAIGGGGGGDNGNGNGGGFNSAGGGDGGDMSNREEYYKQMVKENPGNPLFLRNYAQFLYQTKGDLEGAEEYYSRAILADPKDGEILSQYAKLIWELHHDLDRASNYFERAVQAAPQDSHVHAAYASFLWETEIDEDECIVPQDVYAIPPNIQGGATASAGT